MTCAFNVKEGLHLHRAGYIPVDAPVGRGFSTGGRTMGLYDFLNPWARASRLERELNQTRRVLQHTEHKVTQSDAKIVAQEREIRLREGLAAADRREIARLRKLLADGHFRNPATGRLGRKGEVFN